MSSARRIAASRANGMKSKGPVTPEGKARSAANAPVDHGLASASPERASQSIVLINENRDEFIAAHQALIEEYAPATPTEAILVDEIAIIHWRLTRARTMESALMDNQMGLMFDELLDSYESVDEPTRAALAFSKLAEKPSLNLLLRYEARLKRQAERSISNLAAFRAQQQKQREQSEKQELPGEPNPINGHQSESENQPNHDHQFQPLAAHPAPEHPAPPAGTAAPTTAATVTPIAPPQRTPEVAGLPPALQADPGPDSTRTPSPLPRAA